MVLKLTGKTENQTAGPRIHSKEPRAGDSSSKTRGGRGEKQLTLELLAFASVNPKGQG